MLTSKWSENPWTDFSMREALIVNMLRGNDGYFYKIQKKFPNNNYFQPHYIWLKIKEKKLPIKELPIQLKLFKQKWSISESPFLVWHFMVLKGYIFKSSGRLPSALNIFYWCILLRKSFDSKIWLNHSAYSANIRFLRNENTRMM